LIDFNISHNTASAEVDKFLKDDLKDLRIFILRMILFFIEIKKGINQPPRPGNELCKNQIINCPGHPSFKRRGNVSDMNK
jgi:hypothetical protein